ncbi:MAG: transcription-repair coupling factor [Phycisphaerae bacterium]
MFEFGLEGKKLIARILDLLTSAGPITIEGLWGSSAPLLATHVANQSKKTILYLTAHIDQADHVQEDLELFSGSVVEVLPGWEGSRPEILAGDEIAVERVGLLSKLIEGNDNGNTKILAAPIQSLLFPVPTPEVLRANSLTVKPRQKMPIEQLAGWLAERGYNRLDQVEQPGDFSIRGDIVDIYPSGVGFPVRCDFFDDQIETIRRFDPASQRSHDQLEHFQITAVPEFLERQPSRCFLEYLPDDTLIFWHEPLEIAELGRTFLNRLPDPVGLYPYEAIFEQAKKFKQISLVRFTTELKGERVRVEFNPLPKFDIQPDVALDQLLALRRELKKVYVFCENIAQRDRLSQLLAGKDKVWNEQIQLVDGLLTRGFIWRAESVACVGDHEIFHRYEFRHRLRRGPTVRTVDHFLELEPGDYVVHVNHGIGRFDGLKTLKTDGRAEEFMAIKYADSAVVHVPVSQLDLVQKYVGGFKGHPPLSTLGSKTWQKTKERVTQAVSSLAAELLDIQARRESLGGISFPADSDWQRQVEESFIYQETEDQLLALRDIKLDMQRNKAMDRLLCGDVGYGKTELALRAAFKAMEAGYQVAVLVPTTILAEQHYRTFRERLAEFPFTVEFINRFKTKSEQAIIVAQAANGKIDLLVGTHRILSKDVSFANLGLVIVDEEQRFGVIHKERLKKLRATVDILTLTATPIPRTLHMSLIGLRDISTLATPPLDRRSIHTEIRKFDIPFIRQAILRELNRDGQVFFVHNYVHGIEELADKLSNAVPEAKFIVGHGQMHERQLERVMLKFLRREADVLVCTTIIESGLDIPTVNTIIINNADRFGLANLHQLRGRVGRYKYRAYAYLLVPNNRPITPIAERRLRAIEEYSELGAGFRIAMRDLEIRGAGNILGPEQSGHIGAVGYELYCELLSAAVRRLKNEEEPPITKANIDLGLSGFIPTRYIGSERQRLEVYRRLAQAQTIPQIDQLEKDIKDIFGKSPGEVNLMLSLARLRLLAGKYTIRTIAKREQAIIFNLQDPQKCQEVFERSPIPPRFADPTEVHLRFPPRYLEPKTLLRTMFKMLEEKEAASRKQ